MGGCLVLLLISLPLIAPAAEGGAPISDVLSPLTDSTGAVLQVKQTDGTIQIRTLFVNQNIPTDTLTYTVSVRRQGKAGSSRSTQSGSFATAPGRIDTLSTMQFNLQPGDKIHGTLTARRGTQNLDTAHVHRTVP